MKTSSNNQFGLIVAYVLPGFIGLAGIAPFIPAVFGWVAPVSHAEANFGSPIYTLLAATTVGLIVSCFRWLLVDRVHQWTGVTLPVWDDRRLEQRLASFNYLVESHYRYYQFVANTLVAVLWAYSVNRFLGTSPFLGAATDVGVLVLAAVLFAASRDSLLKYYTRTNRLIGQVGEQQLWRSNHVQRQSQRSGNRNVAKAGSRAKATEHATANSESRAAEPRADATTEVA